RVGTDDTATGHAVTTLPSSDSPDGASAVVAIHWDTYGLLHGLDCATAGAGAQYLPRVGGQALQQCRCTGRRAHPSVRRTTSAVGCRVRSRPVEVARAAGPVVARGHFPRPEGGASHRALP